MKRITALIFGCFALGCISHSYLVRIDSAKTHPDTFPLPFVRTEMDLLCLGYDTTIQTANDSLLFAQNIEKAQWIAEYDAKSISSYQAILQSPLDIKDSIREWFMMEEAGIKRILFGKSDSLHFEKYAEVIYKDNLIQRGFYRTGIRDLPLADTLAFLLQKATTMTGKYLTNSGKANKYSCYIRPDSGFFALYFFPVNINEWTDLDGAVSATVLVERSSLKFGMFEKKRYLLEPIARCKDKVLFDRSGRIPDETELSLFLIHRFQSPGVIIKTENDLFAFTFDSRKNSISFGIYKIEN